MLAASDGSQSAPLGYAAGELRVRASTLMHLDDLPAELAGWGPIHAHLARTVAKRQIGGEWRFAVCDEDGHLLFAGVTRRRPGGWPHHQMGVAGEPEPEVRVVPVRGRGIVELQFPLSLLRALHADLHALGGWAGVVADVVGQYEAAGPDHAPGEGAGDGDGGDAGEGPSAGTGDSGDGRRRFPRAGLRRHIQVRDRVCTHPGCRAPATRSELDHTRPYAAGGSTSEGNLAAACAHDHDLRDNGWQVVRTAPGHVTWISRTGHRYPAQPPPVIEPLPEPFAPAGWAHLRPADSGYGAGNITDPAVDELPYVPAYRYEPAWWEEPLAKPDAAQEVTVRAGPPADPAEDIPPV
ncbi:HNH endonuclease signature motif containing protein [Microtetraspora malaysiensis]|uniref:HNH endonuclease signature motif containing protein n=1 Tax=Microtetraspora malaysiensis TaxID=161358 RepID=A0ABW6SNB9_9ACTN